MTHARELIVFDHETDKLRKEIDSLVKDIKANKQYIKETTLAVIELEKLAANTELLINGIFGLAFICAIAYGVITYHGQ